MECTPKTIDCAICTFFCYHEQVVCDSLRFVKDKNKCMAVLLKLSTSLADLYPARNSMATTASETTALVTKELMGLLGVGLEKISCIRHVGDLARLAPQLRSLQLKSGWGEFWINFRKIGKAVNRQPNRECRLLVLAELRRVIQSKLPEDSAWPHILRTEENANMEIG